MSILFASKPVDAGGTPQPLFQFLGSYVGSTSAVAYSEISGCSLLSSDLRRYLFTSMLVRDPMSVDACDSFIASHPGGALQRAVLSPAGAAEGTKGMGAVDATQGKPRAGGGCMGAFPGFLPRFATQLLVDPVLSTFNQTMPSLYSGLPWCVPEDHRSNRDFVKCVKIERPAVCVRYLVTHRPCLYQHASNGCKVCVYTPPLGDGEYDVRVVRVFVMCFGCQSDGKLRVPLIKKNRCIGSMAVGDLWPWCEIFDSDLRILHLARKAAAGGSGAAAPAKKARV
eukprot:115248-Rhodomonas_salina.1